MKKFTFNTAMEAHKFGYEANMPFVRIRELYQMSSREIHGLRFSGAWVLGVELDYRSHEEENWERVQFEFLTLDGFRMHCHRIASNDKFRLITYYCYQLSDSRDCVIHLENLSRASIDKQLTDYTGDGYGMLSFHNESNEQRLSPGGVVVHKKTGLKFFIPSGLLEEV